MKKICWSVASNFAKTYGTPLLILQKYGINKDELENVVDSPAKSSIKNWTVGRFKKKANFTMLCACSVQRDFNGVPESPAKLLRYLILYLMLNNLKVFTLYLLFSPRE